MNGRAGMRWGWLLLSVAVHAGLLAGVLALAGVVATPRTLFVDLVRGFAAADGSERAEGTRRDGGAQVRRSAPKRTASAPAGPAGLPRRASRAPALEPPPAREPTAQAPPVMPRKEATRPPAVPAPASEPAPVPEPIGPALASEPLALAADPAPAVSEPGPPAAPASPAPRPAEPAPPSALASGSGPGVAVTGPAPLEATSGGGGGASSPPEGGPAGHADGTDRLEGPGRGGGPGGGLARAVPGEGDGALAEYGAYLALVRRRIHERLTYPSSARHRGLSGTVQIEVEIAASGAVGHVSLAVSSAHRALDEAALDAARGLRRVPFPPDVRPRPLRVRLPVVFELR